MRTTLLPLPLLAIARRELLSFFRTPQGWIVAALLLFLSGLVFTSSTIVPGGPASLRAFFASWWTLLTIIAPALSMRLFAEEFRTGTAEPLLSSPPSELTLVVGKFLGAAGFLLACLVPTLSYVLILELLASPDYGPILAGYLGVVLLGIFYLAVGTLFSTLTSSQTLAFIATLFALLLLELGSAQGAEHLPAPWSQAAEALQVAPRLADFARGLISPAHVLFFLISASFLLCCSALVLRVRRWR